MTIQKCLLITLLALSLWILTALYTKAETPILEPFSTHYSHFYLLSKMKELRMCESGGNDLAIHEKDGNSASYGRYQWKLESIWYYQQKYHLLPDIEEQELPNIIMEPEIQDLFTYKVLDEGGWRNWTNCWLKISKL